MRTKAILLAGTVLAVSTPRLALAAPDAAPAEAQAAAEPAIASGDIVVTARKREESLKDVPVAVSAITGDTIEKRGFESVKDAASLAPGLSINSDGAGRAFIAIRGVGVTLVDTVQPGVGIFIDGIYQPNTSYLNNPLVDVSRVEVLRGPQGTLYGKNTLGGAINVITRQPGNEVEGRLIGSYAGPDDSWFAAASLSGPIVRDHLQARIAYAHREQDGFITNATVNLPGNPLRTDTLSGTVRFEPTTDVVLTVNGSYDWVKGGAVPYSYVTGPTDYERTIRLNTSNYQYFHYKRANAKLEIPVGALSSKLTLIGSYDQRDVNTPAGDLDFSPVDIARNTGTDRLITKSAEARLDSTLGSTLTSIVGLYYSSEARSNDTTTILFPGVLNITNRQTSRNTNDTAAVFGTLFWKPTDKVELSGGLRYDDARRTSTGAVYLSGVPQPIAPGHLVEKHVSPRVAFTYHWTPDFMTYASVARGFRGGGFNSPVAPFRTYTGDNVWTYELGSKVTSADRRLSLSGDVYYNNYKNYIGLNSIAPAITGGFTTVDLNSGDVHTYGIELEGSFRPVKAWTLSGGVSYNHARLINTTAYTTVTGRTLASNRLPFQPDWTYNLNSDVVIPLGNNELDWALGVAGKGSRIAASLSQTNAPVLRPYGLVNTALTLRHGGFELTGFADNLLNKTYFESYIEKTTLILAGLAPTDVGIVGEGRRYGVRARIKF